MTEAALSPAPNKTTAANAPVVVGFSGGGDSTFLLRDLCARGETVVAAIVDHSLRAGSAADAQRAAAIAREAGAEAEILKLSWPNGAKPAQDHARRARMAALGACARAHGAGVVDLAHTLDDQAETVLIRLAAGSSWRGLAGMGARAPLPLWPEGRGLTLRRPILGARRADIRAALKRDGAAWLEDPANELNRYARVRARAQLAAWEGRGMGAARWAALADAIAPYAAALDEDARACIAASITFEADTATIEADAFASFGEETRLRALGVVAAAIGGAERAPADDGLRRVLTEMRGTLGGAWFSQVKGGLKIGRDPGGVRGRSGLPGASPAPISPGQEVVWDRRVALRVETGAWLVTSDPASAQPLFTRENSRLTLLEAEKTGLVQAHWLFHERIAHLLWR